MAGGQLNGSGVYGPVALAEAPAATVLVPTMIQTSADIVDTFAHLTCLYDRFWYNRGDIVTVPICFFYVKKISETIQVETSEQRVLLYEPQAQNATSQILADQIRPGVQEVIVDNSVVKPKTYQMEVVLPFQTFSKQFARTLKEMQQIVDGFTEIFAGQVAFENLASGIAPSVKMATQLADIAASVTQNTEMAKYVNKNSLEAMATGQKVLTMKMWTGYDYKYVQITGLDITKQPNEDDVFRATIQLKERPVLTMTPVTDVLTPSGIDRNWAARIVSGPSMAYSAVAAKLTGTAEASGLNINA